MLSYVFAINSNITPGGDDAQYILLAESIQKGLGYSRIHAPDNPPETQYPFVFPLLLTPFVHFFSNNIQVLKLVCLLCGLFSLLVFSRLTKQQSTDLVQLSILAIAVSPHFFNVSTEVLSEAPFMLFSFLALLFLNKYVTESTQINKNLWTSLLFIFLSFYTRTIGITLFFAIVLYLILKREFKKCCVVSVGFFLGIILISLLLSYCEVKGHSGYFNSLFLKDPYNPEAGNITIISFLYRIFYRFATYSGRILSELICPFPFDFSEFKIFSSKLFFSLILSLVISVSLVKDIYRKINISDCYLLTYFLCILTWSWYGPRFLIPVLPLLFLHLFAGFNFLLCRSRSLFMLISVIIIFSNVGVTIPYFIKEHKGVVEPEWANYLKAVDWIKHTTAPNSIIMCRKPPQTYFYSKRKSVWYPWTSNTNTIMTSIKENKVNYIIVDGYKGTLSATQKFLIPAIEKNIRKFEYIYSTEKPITYVYKIVK